MCGVSGTNQLKQDSSEEGREPASSDTRVVCLRSDYRWTSVRSRGARVSSAQSRPHGGREWCLVSLSSEGADVVDSCSRKDFF